MLLAKKEQYYQIIANHENKKFFNGFTTFFQFFNSLVGTAGDGEVGAMLILLSLAIKLSAILGFIFPFMLFFLMESFISQKEYLLIVLSCINLIAFIIVNLGLWGKIHCFCLYKPHQWLFFMIIFDMIHFLCNNSIFFLIMDRGYFRSSYNNNYYGYLIFGYLGSVVYSISFFIIHAKIGEKLIILFNTLRTLETNVIKFCTFEYIKELKRKSENIN